MVTNTQILEWLNTYAQVIADHKDYLTQLDAAIGDADHGININRGFQRVATQLPDLKNSEIGNIFKTVSMTLISSGECINAGLGIVATHEFYLGDRILGIWDGRLRVRG